MSGAHNSNQINYIDYLSSQTIYWLQVSVQEIRPYDDSLSKYERNFSPP